MRLHRRAREDIKDIDCVPSESSSRSVGTDKQTEERQTVGDERVIWEGDGHDERRPLRPTTTKRSMKPATDDLQ